MTRKLRIKGVSVIAAAVMLIFFTVVLFHRSKDIYLKVRPVRLKIIDDRTGKPVSGMTVYHQLEISVDDDNLLSGFLSDGPGIKSVKTDEYTTDSSGEIYIPEDRIKTTVHDGASLEYEKFLVNMNPAEQPEGMTAEEILFSMPFSMIYEKNLVKKEEDKYQSMEIICSAGDIENVRTENNSQEWVELDGFSNSFAKKTEDITVRLKRTL